jgi:hypothetical protein
VVPEGRRDVFHQYYIKIKENGLQLLSTGGAKQNPIRPAILRGGSGFFVPYWVPMERSEIGKPMRFRGRKRKKEVSNDLFFCLYSFLFGLA